MASIVLATGNAVLLGLFATLWQNTGLACGTLSLFFARRGLLDGLGVLLLSGMAAIIGYPGLP